MEMWERGNRGPPLVLTNSVSVYYLDVIVSIKRRIKFINLKTLQ